MRTLRAIDETGIRMDYETEFVPRIGERVVVGQHGSSVVRPQYYRVKDVAYHLSEPPDVQATILIEEETDPAHWPS